MTSDKTSPAIYKQVVYLTFGERLQVKRKQLFLTQKKVNYLVKLGHPEKMLPYQIANNIF